MTFTGVLLIPLCLIIIVMPWRWALVSVLVLSLLASSAVFNLGSFGLQPGYFFGMLMVGRTAVELAFSGGLLRSALLLRLAPLGALLALSVLLLWVAIIAFHGKVQVVGGTDSFNLDRAQPYEFRRENITQITYLTLNALFVFVIAHQGAKLGTEALRSCFQTGMVAAIVISAFVCLWQMASFYAGVPFADAFFFSNAGYAKASGQALFGILRVNGLFSEPSALAYFYIAFLCFCWSNLQATPTMRWSLLTFTCVAMMILSTSTTAFLLLAAFALMSLPDVWRLASRSFPGGGGLTVTGLTAMAVLLVSLVAGAVMLLQYRYEVDQIFTSMVLEKQDTSSFEQRTGVDRMALDIFVETYGLGIGLGSHKPSSLGMTILSNLGAVGSILFLAMIVSAVWPLAWSGRSSDPRRQGGQPIMRAFCGLVLAHAVSNPNLSYMFFWLLLGYLVGYVVALDEETAADGSGQPQSMILAPARAGIPDR